MQALHVVTGAFGYSGRYIAGGLIAKGHRVRTLTNSPHRQSPLQGQIEVRPLDFTNEPALVESLVGAKVLYNTYWVRFDHATFNHEQAVHDTKVLFDAARKAGVSRIVHVSITNPSVDSALPYFSGKARLEVALAELGVPHTILRPAVLFGGVDILINNIAWALRHLPVFGVFGRGDYQLRPIHVEDFATLAIQAGEQRGNVTIDAVGPESFTFRELSEVLGHIIGRPRPIISVPHWLGYLVARCIGLIHRDVFLTREEIAGLTAGLLESRAPSTGTTRLTDWARAHADELGHEYASEMRRRRDRSVAYSQAVADSPSR
ncbi:MAG: NAD(P)H-binding protein [Polyangiaceae bacterium]